MKNKISIKRQTPRTTAFKENFADNIDLFYKGFKMGLITTKAWGDFSRAEEPLVSFSFDGNDYYILLSKFKKLFKK